MEQKDIIIMKLNSFEAARSLSLIAGKEVYDLVLEVDASKRVEITLGLISGGLDPEKSVLVIAKASGLLGDIWRLAAEAAAVAEKLQGEFPALLSAFDGEGHGGIQISAMEGGAAAVVYSLIIREKEEYQKHLPHWDFLVAIAEVKRQREMNKSWSKVTHWA